MIPVIFSTLPPKGRKNKEIVSHLLWVLVVKFVAKTGICFVVDLFLRGRWKNGADGIGRPIRILSVCQIFNFFKAVGFCCLHDCLLVFWSDLLDNVKWVEKTF